MTSIYTLKQTMQFSEENALRDPIHPGIGNVITKVIQSGSLNFPSNVINCSIMITQNTTNMIADIGAGTTPGGISFLGSGVENISSVGTQVYFDAWMTALCFNTDGDNFQLNKFLDPSISNLTIVAIAECE